MNSADFWNVEVQTIRGEYPLVNKQFAIESGDLEIVDLPINSMVDLSIVMLTFTRGYLH